MLDRNHELLGQALGYRGGLGLDLAKFRLSCKILSFFGGREGRRAIALYWTEIIFRKNSVEGAVESWNLGQAAKSAKQRNPPNSEIRQNQLYRETWGN